MGKSTVAAALGLVAARRGRRTIIAELASQDRTAAAFDTAAEPFVEVPLAEGLFTISIDPQGAMEEYLRIKTGPLGQALASSRLFATFAMATPGMRELLSIGKAWELAQVDRRTARAQPYDLVIVDAPATGHGVGALRTPRTFAEIARVGPIAQQATRIAATIADRDFTGIVVVTTAEEMPVNETIAIAQALARDRLAIDAVVVNALYGDRFGDHFAHIDGDGDRLAQAAGRARSTVARAAIKAALSERARAAAQQQQRRRLKEGLPLAAIELPYLFSAGIGRPELECLAEALTRAWPDLL